MQVVAEYCGSSQGVQDGGCDMIRLVFHRVTTEVAELSLQTGLAGPLYTASVVASGQLCSAAPEPEVDFLASSLHTNGMLLVELLPNAVGTFHVCVNGLVVADVVASTPDCPFDTALSPCEIPACTNEGFESNECQQHVAEYCRHKPDDTGCALFVPLFTIYADTESHVALHAAVESAQAVVVGTTCELQATEVEILRVEGEAVEGGSLLYGGATPVVSLTLFARHVGTYDVCAGGHLVARVTVRETELCGFGVSFTPCEDPACTDPASDDCVQTVAQYCADFPEDASCGLVTLVFRRVMGRTSRLQIHVPAADRFSLPFFSKAGSACDPASEEIAIQVLAAGIGGNLLSVDFLPLLEGSYDLCVGRSLLAGMMVAPDFDDCRFQTGATPCLEEACKPGGDEIICMQSVAEYCAFSQDTACAFVVPLFRYGPGVQTVSLHATESVQTARLAGDKVLLADSSCGCSATCPTRPPMQEVLAEDKALLVDFFFKQNGAYSVCLGTELLAKIIVDDSGCTFADSDLSPCTVAVCVDSTSDACMQYVAEYCASQGFADTACEFLMPMFHRVAATPTKLSFATEVEEIFFAVNDCATPVASSVEMLSVAQGAGAMALEVILYALGEVQLCAVGSNVPLAAVTVKARQDCIFDTEVSPCTSAQVA
jgi:hypothetical protein